MHIESLIKELQFKAVRSSGAGGQHVNKVSSKVEVYFDIINSNALSQTEKELLLKNLTSKLSKEGILILSSSESRSQHANKEKVVKRLLTLLENNLKAPTKRIATKVSKAQKAKRLENKHRQAAKKSLRKRPDWD